MQNLIPLAVLSLILAFSASRSTEAPTGFDNKSNGVADDATHEADQMRFEEVELVSDGLGPLYNAQSCRECHQSPVSGAASQVADQKAVIHAQCAPVMVQRFKNLITSGVGQELRLKPIRNPQYFLDFVCVADRCY